MSLQPALLPLPLIVVLWALVLVTPVLAWVLSALLVGGESETRWRRAALPVGRTVGVTLAAVVLARLLEAASGAMQDGPLGWLHALDKALTGHTSRTWYPLDAVLMLALAHAVLFLVAAPILALRERNRRGEPFRVPLASPLAVALVGVPVLSLVALHGPYLQDRPGRVLLDLASVLPMVCVALAVWTRSERAAPVVISTAVAAKPVTPVEVAALWQRAGAVEGRARPLLATPGVVASGGAVDGASRAWQVAGGSGPAPRALEDVSAAWSEPRQGWLVGDLPDPTERHFLAACLVRALQREGLTCLVVADAPEALRDAVEEAFARLGRWPPGALVAGAGELRDALVGHRMPAAVFLDVEGLSSEGIAALGGASDGCGRLWARSVGLVLLSQVDRGTPLATTHRMFTLRRLGLALSSAGARWGVLATGVGGVGTRSLVEGMFPGFPVREVPYAPRAAAPVRAWRVAPGFRDAPGTPWVRRALEPVTAAGLPASVGDPGGAFDRSAAEFWGRDVRFTRDVSLSGAASVADLGEAWLVAAYRALPHLAPLPAGGAHDALWSLPDTPLVRFLLRDSNLEGLARNGMLPPPRPLVGRHNGALATAHLKAALREGTQDYAALAAVFGRSRVDAALGQDFRAERHAVRRATGQDEVVRSPVIPALPSAAGHGGPLRRTVSEQVVHIIDGQGGQPLLEVDKLLVDTRFYPGRVFAVGDARYEVPLNAYDTKRGEIRVHPVPHDRPLTRPQLQIRVESASVVESPQTVHVGRASYQVTTVEATVVERVTGFMQVGRPGRVDMGEVTCRYRTRVRALLFPSGGTPAALFHLARSADGVLLAHLLAGDEDIEVVPVQPGLYAGAPAGVAVVDRHLQGMGVAEAMDLSLIDDTFKWVRALLAGCGCAHGCPVCTPQDVLDAGPDKAGVLELLG
ncbi:hypothetical protein JY651_30195 [Pyxidicoccus parkwayensis]|uniref:Uncharacterized protein n=1 Tax=Pyxidicoccus parkwayensis TaxID=2813578 RepID=A0ABX7NME1_9BACT|nr:hypothetical protein [Pyxidicoccus parkwaysis]QSQ19573.1 hypothetical protein JY651_30195 [Pyxidicoccus parkwaysis]